MFKMLQLRKSLVVLAMTAGLIVSAHAGSLNPTAGPAASMKPLDKVEPRIAISAENTPGDSYYLYVIRNPGSYYLTENVMSNRGGIQIWADDVTIDMMGFTLAGNGTTTYDGIGLLSLRKNVEIKNGTVKGFNFGISQGHTESEHCRVLNVTVASNKERGISFIGKFSTIKDCVIKDNGIDSTAYYTHGLKTGDSSNVIGNTIFNNGTRATSTYYYILGVGNGSIVKDNLVFGNAAQANKSGSIIYTIIALSGSIVTGNTVRDNAGSATCGYFRGISASYGSSVIGNTVYGNGTNIAASGNACGIYTYGYCVLDRNSAYMNAGTNMNSDATCQYGLNVAP